MSANSISESISITVYDAAGRDSQGYNSAGYNNQGLNAANDYNPLYDESISPA